MRLGLRFESALQPRRRGARKARLSRGGGRGIQRLALTAKGWRHIPILTRLADANDAEFFACLSESAQATIESAMREIARRHGLRAVPVE